MLALHPYCTINYLPEDMVNNKSLVDCREHMPQKQETIVSNNFDNLT